MPNMNMTRITELRQRALDVIRVSREIPGATENETNIIRDIFEAIAEVVSATNEIRECLESLRAASLEAPSESRREMSTMELEMIEESIDDETSDLYFALWTLSLLEWPKSLIDLEPLFPSNEFTELNSKSTTRLTRQFKYRLIPSCSLYRP